MAVIRCRAMAGNPRRGRRRRTRWPGWWRRARSTPKSSVAGREPASASQRTRSPVCVRRSAATRRQRGRRGGGMAPTFSPSALCTAPRDWPCARRRLPGHGGGGVLKRLGTSSGWPPWSAATVLDRPLPELRARARGEPGRAAMGRWRACAPLASSASWVGRDRPTMAPVHRDLIERVGGERARLCCSWDRPLASRRTRMSWSSRPARSTFATPSGTPSSWPACAVPRPLPRWSLRPPTAAPRCGLRLLRSGEPELHTPPMAATEIPRLLQEKLERGGCVTLASAAAITLGIVSLPVYEIYKVGEAVHWLDGLDLLSVAGIRAAVITHWDNAEGGTHDPVLLHGRIPPSRLESMLPEGSAILGVDEHTALILDLGAGRVEVRGRGQVVVRRGGASRSPHRRLHLSRRAARDARRRRPVPARPPAPDRAPAPSETVDRATSCHWSANVRRNSTALVTVATSRRWSRPSSPSTRRWRSGPARPSPATSATRHGASCGDGDRLGEVAVDVRPTRERVAPLVDAVLALRRQWRGERRFDDADRLRQLLAGCRIEVRDGHQGEESGWELADAPG